MSMARLVVTAVRVEGRSISAVARDYQVSRRWVHELLRRYDTQGEAGLEPRSRRPHHSPHATSAEAEQQIITLRKQLADQGLDAGACTIAYHLTQRHGHAPAPATIWRILTRRGFVAPQPRKRPRSSWKRFEADQPTSAGRPTSPTGCWPLVWRLRSSTSWTTTPASPWPVILASHARPIFKAADVLASVTSAISTYGLPAAVLTDNGAVFAGRPRGGGRVALEVTLTSLGVSVRHSRPYHPQTCGKAERFHQTLKQWLARHPRAATTIQLQGQLDTFRPTTTPSARTERWAGARRPRPTPPAPRQHRAAA